MVIPYLFCRNLLTLKIWSTWIPSKLFGTLLILSSRWSKIKNLGLITILGLLLEDLIQELYLLGLDINILIWLLGRLLQVLLWGPLKIFTISMSKFILRVWEAVQLVLMLWMLLLIRWRVCWIRALWRLTNLRFSLWEGKGYQTKSLCSFGLIP